MDVNERGMNMIARTKDISHLHDLPHELIKYHGMVSHSFLQKWSSLGFFYFMWMSPSPKTTLYQVWIIGQKKATYPMPNGLHVH